MDKQSSQDPSKKRLDAYQRMLYWIKQNISQWHNPEHHKQLSAHLAHAKQKILEFEQLSEDEVQKIAGYLERDMHEAAYFLVEAKKWLSDWLYFDYKVIEHDLWQAFSEVANKTALEYEQFNYDLKHGLIYYSDEIIGLGSVQCLSCQYVIHFKQVSVIPECPGCGHKEFTRYT